VRAPKIIIALENTSEKEKNRIFLVCNLIKKIIKSYKRRTKQNTMLINKKLGLAKYIDNLVNQIKHKLIIS
jgi:hypothetical protein